MPEAIPFDKSALTWTLPWDADWVTAVCFPGPGRIAAGNNLGQILVWDLPDKPGGAAPLPVRRLDGHTNVITRLCATKDGRWLISSSNDHSIRFWDMKSEATGNATVGLNARRREEALSPAGKRAGKKVPPAIEARVKTWSAARVLTSHKEWVASLALSKDERLLISGDDAGKIIVHDRESGKELRRWPIKGWCYAVALSPDNKQAFVSERLPLVFDSGRHFGVKLFDADKGTLQRDLSASFKDNQISVAAYSGDGKLLALGRGGEVNGLSGKTFLIEPKTGKKVRELGPGHEYGVTDLAFHPDGKHLASAGRDTTVRIWNVADGKQVAVLGKPRGGQFKDWIHSISFSADGRRLAAADMAGAVQVWSLGTP